MLDLIFGWVGPRLRPLMSVGNPPLQRTRSRIISTPATSVPITSGSMLRRLGRFVSDIMTPVIVRMSKVVWSGGWVRGPKTSPYPGQGQDVPTCLLEFAAIRSPDDAIFSAACLALCRAVNLVQHFSY